MVQFARNRPLKFIAIILGLLAVYLVSGTDMFSRSAKGEAAAGAIQYIHIDAPTTVYLNKTFNAKIALVDQQGNPISGRVYGDKGGEFDIPSDGLKLEGGGNARLSVDKAAVKEILNSGGQGTGIYVVPVTVLGWVDGQPGNTYTLEADYHGSVKPDNATAETYILRSTTTVNAEVPAKPGVVKYMPTETDSLTLKTPETKPGGAPAEPIDNVVTFKVKLVGQARDPATNSRRITGQAEEATSVKWMLPTINDSTGSALDASIKSVKEIKKDVVLKQGEKSEFSTANYEIQVNIKTPAELAGRRAVIELLFQDKGLTNIASAVVNFASAGPEDKAPPNIFLANPYLIENPKTPQVDPSSIMFWGIDPGSQYVEFDDQTEYPTAGNAMISISGDSTVINGERLEALIEDPDMINIKAAEWFRGSIGADGTGTAMLAKDGVYNSDAETVTYYFSSATIRALAEDLYTYYVHGQNVLNNWGHGSEFGNVNQNVDWTLPTCLVTKPVTNEYCANNNYLVQGDSDATIGGGYPTSMNSVAIYEEGTGDFTETATNDSGRGGVNFSKWFAIWDTTFSAGEAYVFQAIAIDSAGNKSTISTVSVFVDNTKPLSNYSNPTVPVGWDNGATSSVDMTGDAYDVPAPITGVKQFDRYTLEWASGHKLFGDETGWNTTRMTFAPGHPGGTGEVTAGALGSWDITTLSEGDYTLRLSSHDTAGNQNLDFSSYPTAEQSTNMNRIFVHVDNTIPTVAIDSPVSGWYAKTITGTAADTHSGLTKVETLVQRLDTNDYWDGASWVGTLPSTWPEATVYAGTGTLTAAASSILRTNTVLKAGTICQSINDRNAIGGTWTGLGPYLLTVDRTLAADRTLSNTLTIAGGSMLKTSSVIKAGSTCTSDFDRSAIGGTWAGSTLSADRTIGTTTPVGDAYLHNTLTMNWEYTVPDAAALPRNTNIRVRARSSDAVKPTAHLSAVSQLDGLFDPDKPVSSITPGPTGMNGWYNIYQDPVQLSISATDTSPGSGMNGGSVWYVWTTTSVGTAPVYNTTQLAYAASPVSINAPTGSADGNGVFTTGASPTMSNGRYRLWYFARDVAKNVETWHFTDIKVDITIPTTPTMTPENTYTHGTTNTVYSRLITDNNQDNTACTYQMQRATDSGFTTDLITIPWFFNSVYLGNPYWYNAFYNQFYGMVDNQIYYYRAQARDYAGNITAWGASVNSRQDNAVSVINQNSGAIMPKTWYNTIIGIQIWVTDSASGPRGFRWTWEADPGSDWVNMSVSGGSTGNTQIPGVGKRVLYVRGYDNIYSNDYYGSATYLNPWTLLNGTVLKAGTVIESKYDKYRLGGTWSGSGPYTLSTDLTLTANKTMEGSITFAASSVIKSGQALWMGTVASALADTTAIGGTWSTGTPYSLLADRNVSGDKTLSGTLARPAAHQSYSDTFLEFWYDPYPPYNWQSFNYPATYDGWAQTQTPTCTITIQDDIAVPSAVSGLKVTEAKYAYSTNGGTSWSGWLAAGCSGSDGSQNVETVTAASIPFNQDSPDQNQVKFQIADVAGSVTESSAYTVKVDGTPPSVTSTVPANDPDPDTPAPLVPPNTPLRATFNDDMLVSSVTNVSNYTLEMADPGLSNWSSVSLLSATYDSGTKTANIIPTANLTPTKKYRLTVTTGVMDKAGNALASSYVWYFYVSDVRSQIDMPAADAKVYNDLPIHGLADGNDAKFYKLQYGAGSSPGSWTTIGGDENGIAAPVTDGIYTQTDWSDGLSGGADPEIITGMATYKKYFSGTNIDTTTAPGSVRIRKNDNSGPWYDKDWAARKKITISNKNAGWYGALSNYQIKITVPWTEDMKTDFSDLRFTTANKYTLIDYWIESYTTGVSATVWVEVPSIAAVAPTYIFMYYGNSAATSASSVASTFLNNQIYLRTFGTPQGTPYKPVSHDEFDAFFPYMNQNGYGIFGSGYPDRVDHSSNPYGSSDLYTSQYKFLFVPAIGGSYKWGTNSDAASEVLLNTADTDTHTVLVGWYGDHTQATQIDDHSAFYSLTANQPVWLEYRQNEATGAQLAQMGIMVPGEAWKVVNTTNFPGQLFARQYAPIEPTAVIADDTPYETSATLTSSIFDSGTSSTTWGMMAWGETLPAGTDVTVQVRTGGTAVPDGGWTAWSYPRSVSWGDIIPSGLSTNRYIQYRLNLYSDSTGTKTPNVNDIWIYDNELIKWDTSAVSDGLYTIRLLTSISNDSDLGIRWGTDNVLESRVTVTVENTTKPTSTVDWPLLLPVTTTTTYTSSDTFTPPDGVTSVSVMVVGGGGGGGMDMGGGGGGGGVIYDPSYAVTPGVPVTVTVGNGGNGAPAAGTGGQPSGHQYTIPATSGGNSVFGTLTAIGGGFGGSSYRAYTPGIAGGNGGSGGGSSGYNDNAGTFYGGTGTPGQGYRGGNSTAAYYSGGGGGAGGQGTDSTTRADGGPGVLYSNMSPYYFGGGGGGSGYSIYGGNGGIGGGGGGAVGPTSGGTGGAGINNGSPGGAGPTSAWANTPGGNAGANTGGGGGGGSHYNANNKGGDGGSGIVIVQYTTMSPPATTYVKANQTITGSATDLFPGIGAVDIRITRTSDSHYWNGTDWSSTDSNTWVTTDSRGSEYSPWTYNADGALNIFAAGEYTIESRATDKAGAVEDTPYDIITVTGDDGAPTASIDFPKTPEPNNYVGAPFIGITGSASDANFKDRKLEFQKDGDLGWTQIGSTLTSEPTSPSRTWTQTTDAEFNAGSTSGVTVKDNSVVISRQVPTANYPSLALQEGGSATVPTFTASGNMTPGAGVVASDGKYVYVKRYSTYDGAVAFNRIGTGYGGTTAGANYGELPGGIEANSITAFYLDGYLYNGLTNNGTMIQRQNVTEGDSDYGKIDQIGLGSGRAALPLGSSNAWDSKGIVGGAVIKDGSTYKMWYSGYDGVSWRIGYAISSDGISWEKSPANPVLGLGLGGAWDGLHVAYPSVYLDGSTYKMWYSGNDGYKWQTGYATSTDGVTWTRYASNPVLTVGTTGDPDVSHAALATVFKEGPTDYKMWYSGYGTYWSICYATSTDGITWAKQGRVMDRQGTGFEQSHVYLPTVLKDGSTYKMWYTGHDGTYTTIGYATSTNGTTWTGRTQVIARQGGGAWDNNHAYAPSVIRESATDYKLWYSGHDSYRWNGIGYATSTNGTSWTKTSICLATNEKLVSRSNGADLAASSTDFLVTTDGRYVYSIGRSGNNWRVKTFDPRDGWKKIGEFTTALEEGMTSYDTIGLIADGCYLYAVEWGGETNWSSPRGWGLYGYDTARVTRIGTGFNGTVAGDVLNQWYINQSMYMVTGQYDPVNQKVWMGSLKTGAMIFRYTANSLFGTTGTFTSGIFDSGSGVNWDTLTRTFSGSGSIVINTRTGTTRTYSPDTWSSWEAVTGAGPTYTIVSPDSRRFIQYQVVFTGPGGSSTPSFDDITVSYSGGSDLLDTWPITGLSDGQYRLRLTVTDNAGNVSTATSDPVYIDTLFPVATLDNLLNLDGNDTNYVAGNNVDLVGAATDINISSWVIEQKREGAGSWTTLKDSGSSDITGTANSTGDFGQNWDTFSLVADGTRDASYYSVRLRVTDKAGNTTTSSPEKLIYIDNKAPTITSTIPPNAATNVNPSTNVTAYFDGLLYAPTVADPNFYLTPAAAHSLVYQDQGAASYATFIPTLPLSRNTAYTGTLTTAIKSRAGKPMAANYNWNFTTSNVEARVYQPAANTHISGTYPVMGLADGATFGGYRLEYAAGRHDETYGGPWTQIGTDQLSVVSSQYNTQTDWNGGQNTGTVPFGTTTTQWNAKDANVYTYATSNGYTQLGNSNIKWLAPAWSTRKPVTIANTGAAQTNFQVKMTVANVSPMKADYSDIRFTDSDGQTLLNYWIEATRTTPSAQATVWIKIPSIPNGGKTIYMYYGNPGAASAQNPESVFELFDDFTGPTTTITAYTDATNITVADAVKAQISAGDWLLFDSEGWPHATQSVQVQSVSVNDVVLVSPGLDVAHASGCTVVNPSKIDLNKWSLGGTQGFLQAGQKSQLKEVSTTGRLQSVQSFDYPIIVNNKVKVTYGPPNGLMLNGFYASTSNGFGLMFYTTYNTDLVPNTRSSAQYYWNDGTWISLGGILSEDTWYKTSIEGRSQFRLKYYIYSLSDPTAPTTVRSEIITNATAGEKVTLGTRYDNGSATEPMSASWDWVYVNKYATVTPTASFGSAESYQSTGTLTSVVFDGGAATNWQMISWTENVPRGANITVETRANDSTTSDPGDGTWTSWSSPSNYNGGTIIPASQQGKRYIQYRVNFYGNGATLLDLTIWHTPLFSWNTASGGDAVSDGLYTLRLSVTDTLGDYSDARTQRKAVVVSVDNTSPAVTIDDPADNAYLTNMRTVTGTATDNRSSAGKLEVQVDSNPWTIAVGTSRVNENVADAVYSGTWTDATGVEPFDSTIKYSATPGDSMTYTFTGTSVNWVAVRGPNKGVANVQIDSDPAIPVDLYAPMETYQQIVFCQTDLAAASHTVTITVQGTTNPASSGKRVDIDGFDVGGTINWSYDWVTNALSDTAHSFKARATDRAGKISGEATKTYNTDNTNPTTAITSPVSGGAFTTDQLVNGTADDTNFDHYVLDYSYGASAEDWLPIYTGTSAVVAGNLGTWTAPVETPLYDWQTDGDPDNWTPEQQITNFRVNNGMLSGQTSGADGFIKTPAKLTINGNEVKILKLRMRVSNASGLARLYWKYNFPYYTSYSTVNNILLPLGEVRQRTYEDEWGVARGSGPSYFGTESRRQVNWPLQNAGEWVEYTINMGLGQVYAKPDGGEQTLIQDYSLFWPTTGFWAGTVYQLRFDPTETSGVDFDIDYLSVEGADGNYTIRAKTFDRVGRNSTTTVYPVMIDRNNPACTVTYPVNMSFLSGTSITVQGTAVDDLVNGVASGINNVEMRVIQNVDSFNPTVGPWQAVTVANTPVIAAGSLIKSGTILRVGTTCSNVNDRNAWTGSTWTGSGPYTLAADYTTTADRTLSGTLSPSGTSVLKINSRLNTGTTCTNQVVTNVIGGTWTGTGPYTLSANRVLAADYALPTCWTRSETLPAGWHGVQARTTDKAGNMQESNYSYMTVDNDPPPVPVVRAMADKARGGILLSWSPVKDPGSGVDYYIVYRNSSITPVTDGLKYPDNATIIDAEPNTTTKMIDGVDRTFRKFHACNAIDTMFTANSSVRYYVRAVDYSGNVSTASTISVVYDTQPPTTPSGLQAARAGSTLSATLQWVASTDNQSIAEYRIYRATTPGFVISEDKLVGQATVTGTFFTTRFYDGDLDEDTTYYYKVVAYDDSLNPSSESNEASVYIGEKQDFSSSLPHLTFTSSAPQCAICHRAHTSGGDKLLAAPTEADTCFTCHDGSGSNTPSKAEFDYAPSGLHRVKDADWPTGALSCIDCHNPHLNTEKAWNDNFDDDLSISNGNPPDSWSFVGGTWTGTIAPTAKDPVTGISPPGSVVNKNELRQSNTGAPAFAFRDTGIDLLAQGGYFSSQIKFISGNEAFITVAGDGVNVKRGITLSIDKAAGKLRLHNGIGTTYAETDIATSDGVLYRLRMSIDADRLVKGSLYTVTKTSVPGPDTITDAKIASLSATVPAGAYAGSYMEIGTDSAAADFDIVKVNNPGMLQSRYREFARAGYEDQYSVPDDRVESEAFCLSCHGTSADSPGGSQLQYYFSVHNQYMGGMDDQVIDKESPVVVKPDPYTISPRWQEIRDRWKDIKTNPAYILGNGKTLGDLLAATDNGCLYCHGYHGQQFYDKSSGGEEEMCYQCHGNVANYSRDDWNVSRQYNGYIEDNGSAIDYSGEWTTISDPQYPGGSVTQYDAPSANWYDTDWSRRQVITLRNTGAALSDYQAKVTVPYDPAMKADFSDLYFTASDGLTPRSFWIESYTASLTAVVWVKLPSIGASSTEPVYMYYGNPGAASAADGAATFDFFDTFPGSSIDSGKWGGSFTGFSVSGGELRGGNSNNRLQSISAFSYPNILESKIRTVSVVSNGVMTLGYFASTSNSFGLQQRTTIDRYRNNSSWVNISNVIPDTGSYKASIEVRNSSTVRYAIYNMSGTLLTEGAPSNTVSGENIALGRPYDNTSPNQNYEQYWDWVLVRKYTATPPTTIFGQKEFAAAASYSFANDTCSVYAVTGPGCGRIDIYVDGVFQTQVDLTGFSTGNSTLVYNKTGLTSGARHTIDIIPVEASGSIRIDAVKGGGSKHGLTLLEATIKCTSCHGQRAMTDRHAYEGYPTSIITNPANIKQYWSDMRTRGKTINDYCNVCHKAADRKGRVLIEMHTSSKIVPYTVRYPPMVTTPSANGFDRTGYTLGDAFINQENYSGATYTPPANWELISDEAFYGGQAATSTAALDQVEFTFEGSSIQWIPAYGPEAGIAQIFIDDVPIIDGNYQLPNDITLVGTLTAVSGSQILSNTLLKAGTTCTDAADRDALGGTWTGSGPYTLSGDTTVVDSRALTGTLTLAIDSVTKAGMLLKAGTSCTSATDRDALGGTWTGSGPYTLTADRTQFGDQGTTMSGWDLYYPVQLRGDSVPNTTAMRYQITSLDPSMTHTLKIVNTGITTGNPVTDTNIYVDAFQYTVPRVGHFLYMAPAKTTTITSKTDSTHFTVADAVAGGLAQGVQLTIDPSNLPHTTQYVTVVNLVGNDVEVAPGLSSSHGVDCIVRTNNCASTCHDDLPEYIRNSQEARSKVTCVTCHHPHATDNARIVHQHEDFKDSVGVVHKGACLHCHDGSVTK